MVFIFQYPFGKRDGEPCDIYWHSVHFGENQDLQGGKVNKFPGEVKNEGERCVER